MNRYILLLCLLLQGCSWLDFIKPSPGISVDTEIVAGDKQEEIATGAVVGKRETRNTSNTADVINQTTEKNYYGKSISDILLLMFMSFLVGWLAMPSTRQMWLMITKLKSRHTS